MAGWSSTLGLLNEELTQRRDEGCSVPQWLSDAIAGLHPKLDAWGERAEQLYDELMKLEPDPALAAAEPNDLAAIKALRPAGPRDLKWQPSEAELLDRLHGAWTGRAVGCALGKPVEGMGMRVENGVLMGRQRIKQYLSARSEWPLDDYFSGESKAEGLRIGCPLSQREQIAFMEPDDDIHYTLVGLGVIEKHGPAFTWSDVAWFWTSRIPYASICTAETQAILNFWNRSKRWPGEDNSAAVPAFTRRHRNPYREWIGAQIRSDGWAYCCAGKPELAAEFAWRDAMWTHERNGIYGEMFCAAMQAAAFVERDPSTLVEIGLSEIPRDCRLARYVRACLGWIKASPDFESCMAKVEAALPTMSPVHTINNALIVMLSLFYGRMDTHQSITTSVMCALDTDCNGASVGSIVGAAAGRKGFSAKLAPRLNDTIKPSMIGFEEVRIAELAKRTAVQWQRVDAYHRERTAQAAPSKANAAAGVAGG